MAASSVAAQLPWLAAPLERLQSARAHALLIYGPEGVGQFELALAAAQSWLCEGQRPPCGECAGCRLFEAGTHPDLAVLAPEALRDALGLGASSGESEPPAEGASKAKPSKEIKVDAVRSAIAFAQTTAARGRGKVVIVYPAERMNPIAANTFLKTLEEPPGDARFLLGSSAPDALLPTIRSRCQALRLDVPAHDVAIGWLEARDIAEAATLLAATGGAPLEALEWSKQGIDAAFWRRLPALVREGRAEALAGWPLPRVVDVLQKLCHDAMCVAAGARGRYFPASALDPPPEAMALAEWKRALERVAENAEHPWNAGLLTESLVLQGQRALGGASGGRRTTPSLNSRP